MCVSDYRIGRLIRYNTQVASVSAAGTMTMLANPQRVGLLICSAIPTIVVSQYITVSIGGNIIAYLFSSAPILMLDIRQHGSFVQQAVLLTSVGATDNLSITEFILPEDYLAALPSDYVGG